MGAHIEGILADLKPIIRCRIARPGGFATDARYSGGIEFSGLVDTGSTDMIIRPEHIELLGLSRVGTTRSQSVGITHDVPEFSTDVVFDMISDDPKFHTFHRLVSGCKTICVSEFCSDYQVIIGMNVLVAYELAFRPNQSFGIYYE